MRQFCEINMLILSEITFFSSFHNPEVESSNLSHATSETPVNTGVSLFRDVPKSLKAVRESRLESRFDEFYRIIARTGLQKTGLKTG